MNKIAIVGASGFVGQNLIKAILDKTDHNIVAIAPDTEKIKTEDQRLQLFQGDVFDIDNMTRNLSGVDTSFYLVHMMNEKGKHFYDKESEAAEAFGKACKNAGVKRIIYLSGLGRENDDLSEHLSSRHNTGEILKKYIPEIIEFRASMIIACGSISFEIVRNLISKLPLIILPKKSKTLTQPIGLSDALQYLISAIDVKISQSEIVEIGGPKALSYEDFLKLYAKWLGKKVKIITVPILPEWIAGSWLYLVTSKENARVGVHMVESFKNEMIVTDNRALELFPHIHPKPVEEFFEK